MALITLDSPPPTSIIEEYELLLQGAVAKVGSPTPITRPLSQSKLLKALLKQHNSKMTHLLNLNRRSFKIDVDEDAEAC